MIQCLFSLVLLQKHSFLYLVVHGGPDGELGASMRYLSQRYTTPYKEVAGLLTDVGSEGSEMFRFSLSPFFDALAIA